MEFDMGHKQTKDETSPSAISDLDRELLGENLESPIIEEESSASLDDRPQVDSLTRSKTICSKSNKKEPQTSSKQIASIFSSTNDLEHSGDQPPFVSPQKARNKETHHKKTSLTTKSKLKAPRLGKESNLDFKTLSSLSVMSNYFSTGVKAPAVPMSKNEKRCIT